MSEYNDTSPDRDTSEHPRHGRCTTARRTRLGVLAAGMLAAGTLLGLGISYAASVSAGGQFGPGHHFGSGHGHGPGGMVGRAGYLLDELDATPEQRERVEAIVADLQAEMGPWKEAHHGNRAAAMALLTAESLDRQAIEALRVSELALADSVSARLVDAFADVADVLTPEQRAEIAEHLARHRGMGHGKRHGKRHGMRHGDETS